LSIFLKLIEKTPVPLKSDKNEGYFTGKRVYIYENISLKFS